MQYRPKAPPPEPKKVDVNRKMNADVPSTSGTKIATSNQFKALNMADTDDFGIPTKEVTLEVTSGSTEEATKDGSLKTATTSQEPLVSDPKEKEQVGTSKPSSFASPSISSTKRVNPFSKVGDIVVSDSDDEEVVNTFDESDNLLGGDHEREYDYDGYDYDDYAQQVYDLPGNLDAFNAMYGTKLQGLRKQFLLSLFLLSLSSGLFSFWKIGSILLCKLLPM